MCATPARSSRSAVRTRPSKPWSRLWLDAVVQPSKPNAPIHGAGLRRRGEDREVLRRLARAPRTAPPRGTAPRPQPVTSDRTPANIGSKSYRFPRPVRSWSSAALRPHGVVPEQVAAHHQRWRSAAAGRGGRRRSRRPARPAPHACPTTGRRRPMRPAPESTRGAGVPRAAASAANAATRPDRGASPTPHADSDARPAPRVAQARLSGWVAWTAVRARSARRRGSAPSGRSRRRGADELDVLVVGGGVVGAGVALDAVTRGLSAPGCSSSATWPAAPAAAAAS